MWAVGRVPELGETTSCVFTWDHINISNLKEPQFLDPTLFICNFVDLGLYVLLV